MATSDPVEPATDDDGLTLGRLVERLGPDLLTVVAAPHGLDRHVGHPTVHDPTEDLVADPDAIVLAVGVAPDGPGLGRLLDRAGELAVTAVLVKARGEVPPPATDAAERAGVALVTVHAQMDWGQLHALVRSASTAMPQNGDATPGGVALGDLFALANAVAAMVGGAVSIEDPQSRVLAYSSLEAPLDEPRRETILGRRVPRGWIDWLREQGVFRTLWGEDAVVRIPGRELPGEPPLRPRLAVAVRAGTEILGSIWVSQGEEPFTDDDEQALAQAARIASLHLVRHRSAADLERRRHADVLRSVLEGRGPLNVLADQLGFDAPDRYAVAAFHLRLEDDAERALQQERTLQLVELYSEAMRHRAVAAAIGAEVYVLLPLGEHALEGVRRLAASVVERARTVLAGELVVGIGGAVDHLRRVPESRADADQVVRVLASRPAGTIATIDDVRPQALLLELRDVAEDHPRFRTGKLDVLAEHDRDRDSDYLPTLDAYLRHFGDVPRAADELAVHPNTFRYRLKRLCEVSGLDLDDADERLVTELQLRLR